ncbi:sterol desaturase family protein [Hydrocarboniphaga effusa]|uniref:sterol desaturase family protein n=1 Tax=Hydrocarboniphaga effusa TaxID=243629 RepID=UPI001ED91A55|nr:sterol desaturase family protein [Hydrocarboniphaga effusa]
MRVPDLRRYANAAAWALLFAALYNLFIHADKRTPYWLGYIVARPEMHRVHHKTDFHANNYGLPLWDLMFGTWENPKERVVHCGFIGDRSSRIFDMLKLRDVHITEVAMPKARAQPSVAPDDPASAASPLRRGRG